MICDYLPSIVMTHGQVIVQSSRGRLSIFVDNSKKNMIKYYYNPSTDRDIPSNGSGTIKDKIKTLRTISLYLLGSNDGEISTSPEKVYPRSPPLLPSSPYSLPREQILPSVTSEDISPESEEEEEDLPPLTSNTYDAGSILTGGSEGYRSVTGSNRPPGTVYGDDIESDPKYKGRTSYSSVDAVYDIPPLGDTGYSILTGNRRRTYRDYDDRMNYFPASLNPEARRGMGMGQGGDGAYS